MNKLLCVCVVLVLASSVMLGQQRKGEFGVTTSVVTTGGTVGTIGAAYALQENMRIIANLGFGSFGPSGQTASGFTVGAGLWYYLHTSDNVSTFVGGDVGFSSNSPYVPTGSTVQSYSSFNIGGVYGAEYWFSPKFSWSGTIGFNFSSTGSSVSGGSSSTSFGTVMGTGLTWFF